MKPILIATLGLLVLVAGGLAIFLVQGKSSAPAGEAAAISSASSGGSASNGAAAGSDDTLARMDALSRQITDLRAEVAALKANQEREAVPQAASMEKPESVQTSTAMDATLHNAILKVIADDRDEQKRKADEEQAQRDLQNALARADRAAQKYGLNVDQRKGLVDVILADNQKTSDLRTQMQNQGWNGDRQAMRKAFDDLDTWRMDELTKRVGPDLAQQVHDGEFNGFPGGPGGGARRGNRGGGGGQNGGQGGGQGGGQPGGG